MERIIEDQELGSILLRRSLRAKHYSLKISRGQILATIPASGCEERMMSFIEESRPKLRLALKRNPPTPIFDESSELTTQTFRLHIFRTERNDFYLSLKEGMLNIACPQTVDFKNDKVQELLNSLIGKALRHEAIRILPKRLKELADKHDFTYSSVKITKSKSNWGSCSVHKSINLSRSLMLVPEYLSDYVLLHELCHTVEMSHNERFWALMNKVTDNKAKALRSELKKYHSFG
jgi:Predicted metal-dependent hydrolase